ncbi:hypothetical protein CMO89_04870 [Candidatus Woesearchaeota archaeon]|nr:hypothetical protein [Candidatus Woesearchaeota archaeon]|tara:strand:+ start:915 stop:1979 length:1065 start_codon:yes stop_codon:yes gene_type:complete
MPKREINQVRVGTLRIKAKDLKVYEKTKVSWKSSPRKFPEAMHVIKLFKAYNNLNALIDKNDPGFLKGQLSPGGKCQDARISILPDGRKLDKAFSLFAEHLTVHDETSNDHWDVLYKNPGGTYSYVYTLGKDIKSAKQRFRAVKEFEKCYPMIKRKVLSALRNKSDYIAVPMYTLLKTYMRIGNEIYYKAHKHKGLTTLKKKDISIKGNNVTFNYLSKGGVPRVITERFPDSYIKRLKEILRPIKSSSFIFVNPFTERTLRDTHFKQAFRRYCGKGFYPHIVRAYYGTEKAKEFLRTHKTATKEEVKELFLSIAEKLGHKRFVKKKHEWENNFNVTIHHYIQPEVLEKIENIAK